MQERQPDSDIVKAGAGGKLDSFIEKVSSDLGFQGLKGDEQEAWLK